VARNLLSETKIKKLTEAGLYCDGDGLFLRIRDTGSRSWVFIWRRKDQKTGKIERHERGLGGYPRAIPCRTEPPVKPETRGSQMLDVDASKRKPAVRGGSEGRV